MVASAGLNSDGFGHCYHMERYLLQTPDGNTIYNGTSTCSGAAPGSPVVPSNASGLYTGGYSLSNPFPGGVVPLLTNPSGLANNLGTTLNTVLHSQRTQTIYNYNFGWEYEFPHQFVLSAAT